MTSGRFLETSSSLLVRPHPVVRSVAVGQICNLGHGRAPHNREDVMIKETLRPTNPESVNRYNATIVPFGGLGAADFVQVTPRLNLEKRLPLV